MSTTYASSNASFQKTARSEPAEEAGRKHIQARCSTSRARVGKRQQGREKELGRAEEEDEEQVARQEQHHEENDDE